jgi:non-heme chloroperoxidase
MQLLQFWWNSHPRQKTASRSSTGPEQGQPIVFSHGWPLSADDWDAQMLFFLSHGYRVIAHDRRGHGRSIQTGDGHDLDHYADDLAALTAHLDLKNAVHIGHSAGAAR